MKAGNENAALVGAGVAACAVCCAGPILGFVAALGAGAIAGTLLFGLAGLLIAAGLSLVTYTVFNNLLGVPLPGGPLMGVL